MTMRCMQALSRLQARVRARCLHTAMTIGQHQSQSIHTTALKQEERALDYPFSHQIWRSGGGQGYNRWMTPTQLTLALENKNHQLHLTFLSPPRYGTPPRYMGSTHPHDYNNHHLISPPPPRYGTPPNYMTAPKLAFSHHTSSSPLHHGGTPL